MGFGSGTLATGSRGTSVATGAGTGLWIRRALASTPTTGTARHTWPGWPSGGSPRLDGAEQILGRAGDPGTTWRDGGIAWGGAAAVRSDAA